MLGSIGVNEAGTKFPFNGTQACANVEDPDIFFPDYERGNKQNNDREKKKEDQAKAICNSCSFIADCLEYALVEGPEGIWGGTNPKERKKIRQRRGMPPPKDISRFIDSL